MDMAEDAARETASRGLGGCAGAAAAGGLAREAADRTEVQAEEEDEPSSADGSLSGSDVPEPANQ
jgi:hypothetical protein